MASASGQASSAFNQAYNTANMLGGEAQGIGANLTPFLTEEMLHPQGFGQQGLSAMTAAALGGAGGAASGLTGQAMQRAAASRNAGGYQAALDDLSRHAAQAGAQGSENIAAQNAQLQQQQQQEGAAGLGGLYKTDTSGMLTAMGQEAPDTNALVNAQSKLGPFNKIMGTLGTIGNLGSGFGRSLSGWASLFG